jgi:hypothetical protein
MGCGILVQHVCCAVHMNVVRACICRPEQDGFPGSSAQTERCLPCKCNACRLGVKGTVAIIEYWQISPQAPGPGNVFNLCSLNRR